MDSVERVRNMVRHTLVVKPDVTNRELLARAKEIAPDAVEGLTLRQFHGRFRLPIMRFEMGSRRRTKKKEAAPATTSPNGGSGTAATVAVGAEVKAPAKTKRSRSKAGAASTAVVDRAVRDILVEFAVELEKAESRSDLVEVMGGVHTFVDRITAVARQYYGSPKGRKPSEN